MALTLRVRSDQALSLGPDDSRVFNELGGSIGRSPGNDWVLADPERFISSHHAAISFRDGHYYLQDMSTNGVYLNGREQPVGRGNTVRLCQGDRLRIGHYEIAVDIDASSVGERVVPGSAADKSEAEQPGAVITESIESGNVS